MTTSLSRTTLRMRSRAGALLWIAAGTATMAHAQGLTFDLPDAPEQQPSGGSSEAALGAVFGTVLDINGGLVPGARITLAAAAPAQSPVRTAVSDSGGRFLFSAVPAGSYTLTIAAQDLETYVSSPFALRAGERHEVPRVALPIARATADVVVTVTQVELATEQVHAAEQQRIFGLLPNFYSSYIWDAAPLNSRQKFGLALHASVDPFAFLGAGFAAGIQQATDTFKGYGQGAAGYGKRYGANLADGTVGVMLGGAVLPSLLHQDPRYFYMGSGTIRHRALYAISTAFICKGDNGRWQPNYSNLGGSLAAAAISNTYYPASDRGVGLTMTNWANGIVGNMVGSLVSEFILRRLTHKVPAYEQGKPQ